MVGYGFLDRRPPEEEGVARGWQGCCEMERRDTTHLFTIQAPVISFDDDVPLAGNVKTGALDLLDVALVGVCRHYLLHFCGRDLLSQGGKSCG